MCGLDVRYRTYLMHEAEAVQRQQMARMAQAVGAGMSGGTELRSWLAALELDRSRADITRDNREAVGIGGTIPSIFNIFKKRRGK